jgi:DNA invertase Pin-like site-specific DNA recombinase
MSRGVLLRTVTIGTPIPNTGLDTTTPAGNALLQIMGVFAEFECSMIAEPFLGTMPKESVFSL